MALREGGGVEEAGDPAAAGGICLEDVDCSRLEQPAEVRRGVAILAGGDIHPGGAMVAQQAESGEVVGGDGLLEPGDVVYLPEMVGEGEGLLAGVGAIGIDIERDVGADRLAGGVDPGGGGCGVGPELHLDGGPRSEE